MAYPYSDQRDRIDERRETRKKSSWNGALQAAALIGFMIALFLMLALIRPMPDDGAGAISNAPVPSTTTPAQ